MVPFKRELAIDDNGPISAFDPADFLCLVLHPSRTLADRDRVTAFAFQADGSAVRPPPLPSPPKGVGGVALWWVGAG